jgi:hypothetical protein
MFFFVPIIQNIVAMMNGADHWERIVHHKCFSPFSIEPLFNFMAFYWFVEVAMFLAVTYMLVNEMVLNTLILMVSMEFDNLADDFGEFEYMKNDKESFSELIERHKKLLAVADEMNSLFRLPIFVFFSVSAVIICFSMLQFTSRGDQLASMGFNELLDLIKFAGYLMIILLQIYLLCFFCEKLRTANENIARNIINGNWYECTDLRMIKDMQIVLIKAQTPVELKAFVFFGINMQVFSSVS